MLMGGDSLFWNARYAGERQCCCWYGRSGDLIWSERIFLLEGRKYLIKLQMFDYSAKMGREGKNLRTRWRRFALLFVYLHVMIESHKIPKKKYGRNRYGESTKVPINAWSIYIATVLKSRMLLGDITLLPPRPSNAPLHSFRVWVGLFCHVPGGSKDVLRIIQEIHVKSISIIGNVLGCNHIY